MYSAVAVAMPSALWRIGLALGFTLGTPDAWRASQEIPGAGTWYVLGLSIIQLVAAACMLALTVDAKCVAPRWLPSRLTRLAPAIVGIAGLAGALLLALLVTMSLIAWEKVDPFAGVDYDGWAWLSATSYLLAAAWPVLLGAASIGYLLSYRRASAGRQY